VFFVGPGQGASFKPPVTQDNFVVLEPLHGLASEWSDATQVNILSAESNLLPKVIASNVVDLESTGTSELNENEQAALEQSNETEQPISTSGQIMDSTLEEEIAKFNES
jgi:hypothetical protein